MKTSDSLPLQQIVFVRRGDQKTVTKLTGINQSALGHWESKTMEPVCHFLHFFLQQTLRQDKSMS